MSTTRESIASEVESLALHASARGLARVHDLLHYIEGEIEDVILDVIREGMARRCDEGGAS